MTRHRKDFWGGIALDLLGGDAKVRLTPMMFLAMEFILGYARVTFCVVETRLSGPASFNLLLFQSIVVDTSSPLMIIIHFLGKTTRRFFHMLWFWQVLFHTYCGLNF